MGQKAVILLVCLVFSQVLCGPVEKVDDKSENAHDKRSVGILGSLFINQLTGGGGAAGSGGHGRNNRPIHDHFGSASNANRPDVAPQQGRGAGVNLNLDLGRLGSNLINGYTAGKQFANAGGAMLGQFFNSMGPQQSRQLPPHRGNIHPENNFRHGSGSSLRHGNFELPPPQPPSSINKQKSRGGKKKTSKNQNGDGELGNVASTGNHEVATDGNSASTLTQDQSFFNQPTTAASSLFHSQQPEFQSQQPQQRGFFPPANDNSAFATNNFNANINPQSTVGFSENQLRPTNGPNYAHSVPASFYNDDQFHSNQGDMWPVNEEIEEVESLS
ncbi:hypothetical protein CHUAL_004626 [Chamberlinius hualienensis]